MARKPRIEFPGAFYHVIARGNNRQKVFADDKDYKSFLERLVKGSSLYSLLSHRCANIFNHI